VDQVELMLEDASIKLSSVASRLIVNNEN